MNKTDRRVRGSGSSELSSNTEKSLGADRTHQTFTLTRESRAPVRIAYHFYFFYEEFYFEFITTYNISEHTFSSGDHTDIASQLSHVRSRSLIKRKSYGTNMILIMPTSMRAQRTWKEMHEMFLL